MNKTVNKLCWLKTNLCLNNIQNNPNLLVVIVDRSLNIVKALKKLKKTGDLILIYKN